MAAYGRDTEPLVGEKLRRGGLKAVCVRVPSRRGFAIGDARWGKPAENSTKDIRRESVDPREVIHRVPDSK